MIVKELIAKLDVFSKEETTGVKEYLALIDKLGGGCEGNEESVFDFVKNQLCNIMFDEENHVKIINELKEFLKDYKEE